MEKHWLKKLKCEKIIKKNKKKLKHYTEKQSGHQRERKSKTQRSMNILSIKKLKIQ